MVIGLSQAQHAQTTRDISSLVSDMIRRFFGSNGRTNSLDRRPNPAGARSGRAFETPGGDTQKKEISALPAAHKSRSARGAPPPTATRKTRAKRGRPRYLS